MRKILILSSVAMSCMITLHAQGFEDRAQACTERAAELLKKLTIEEKTQLMMHKSSAVERLDIRKYNWWNEALHGVGRNGSATVFPQPIGMAASFDDKLIYEVFTAVSDEARVKNRMATAAGDGSEIYQGLTFWTPNINIFRDPRWGRGMETYGEDPYLTGVMGMAVVNGLQGDSKGEILKAHACAKHYAVHSGPEMSRHSYDARISERDLRETYLPAFKDLVTKANVQEVMTAYNRFDGEPCAASGRLVKEILRGEWGYKGMIVSDCWALNDFYEDGRHGFSTDAAEAAAAAIKNGIDVECGDTYRAIPEAIRRGILTEEDLDRCLLRSLAARYMIGEMDRASSWNHLEESIVEGTEHRELSRVMAQKSLVLLQNSGILPLKKGSHIALVGPNADDREMMWGNYNAVPFGTVTLLDALKEADKDIKYVKGCELVGGDTNAEAVLKELDGIETVVFAGGISPRVEGEEMPVTIPGFSGGDRTSIELPQVQRDLIKALKDAGKKVVLVNFSGSAVALVPEQENCEAILQAWYPGQEGGYAIADVLYGEVNPSGKLPVTFYKRTEDLPDFEDYNMKGHTYRYFGAEAEFPFGYGMSYTTFKYGKAKIKGNVLSFQLRNTGKRGGTEVVQLYVSRPDDKEGPAKTLRGFQRIYVPAGKSVKVCFLLKDEVFEWWDPAIQNMGQVKGQYLLHYGSSSADKDLQVISVSR